MVSGDGARLRPGHQRVRLDRADLRQPAVPDPGRLGATSSTRSRATTRPARPRSRPSLLVVAFVVLVGARPGPAMGGPPWLGTSLRADRRWLYLLLPAGAAGRPDRLAHVRERPRPGGRRADRRRPRCTRSQVTARRRVLGRAGQHRSSASATALLLVRHDFPGKRILNALIDLPLAVSPVVVGLALILVYGAYAPLGGWLERHGIQVIFSLPGHGAGHHLRLAAAGGAGGRAGARGDRGTTRSRPRTPSAPTRWQTFRRITLPAIRGALAYGVVLCLARALGEYGAVAVVSGRLVGQTQTATLFVEERYQNFDQTAAFAAATVLALIAVAASSLLDHDSCARRSSLMAIEVRDVNKSFGVHRRCSGRLRRHRVRVADRAARPERRRQVDPAAGHRRARAARLRHGRDQRRGRDPARRRSGATSASCSSTTPRSST